jgi:hypothetical protein
VWNLNTNLAWYLYTTPEFTGLVAACDQFATRAEESCATGSVPLSKNTRYYLRVDNIHHTNSRLSLTLDALPYPTERELLDSMVAYTRNQLGSEIGGGNPIQSQALTYTVTSTLQGLVLCNPGTSVASFNPNPVPPATVFGCVQNFSITTIPVSADQIVLTVSAPVAYIGGTASWIDSSGILASGTANFGLRASVQMSATLRRTDTSVGLHRWVVVSQSITLGTVSNDSSSATLEMIMGVMDTSQIFYEVVGVLHESLLRYLIGRSFTL